MYKYIINFIILLSVFTLLSCQKSKEANSDVDDKSYISNFELLQQNSTKDTSIRITSPKAIIDPTNNFIEVFNSSIEIINKMGQDIYINSGKSSFNNSKNLITVFNDVDISLSGDNNTFIKTHSFYWDMNTSNINLNSPLDINFNNSTLTSSHGSYNIDSSQLDLSNNVFKKSFFNLKGKELYQIQIISDNAKWLKSHNSIEFLSNNKQVETTINFLSVK